MNCLKFIYKIVEWLSIDLSKVKNSVYFILVLLPLKDGESYLIRYLFILKLGQVVGFEEMHSCIF